MLRTRLAVAGLVREEITSHGLWTTFAQRAGAAGINASQIADAMAHLGTATTDGSIRQAKTRANQEPVIRAISRTNGGQRLPRKLSRTVNRGKLFPLTH